MIREKGFSYRPGDEVRGSSWRGAPLPKLFFLIREGALRERKVDASQEGPLPLPFAERVVGAPPFPPPHHLSDGGGEKGGFSPYRSAVGGKGGGPLPPFIYNKKKGGGSLNSF